jgi:hypothetical protein
MKKTVDGLEVLATTSDCNGRNCPTIYRRDDDTLVVQGYEADSLFSEPLPDGERAVLIPASLLDQLG